MQLKFFLFHSGNDNDRQYVAARWWVNLEFGWWNDSTQERNSISQSTLSTNQPNELVNIWTFVSCTLNFIHLYALAYMSAAMKVSRCAERANSSLINHSIIPTWFEAIHSTQNSDRIIAGTCNGQSCSRNVPSKFTTLNKDEKQTKERKRKK